MPTALPIEELIDDDALVAAVCAGDVQKYRLLFGRHAEPLQVHVAFRVWVPHLVSEIVHEAFVWAYGHLNEFQLGTSFQAWLQAIAWNLIRAELQRFARERKHRENYFKHRLWLDRIAAGEECADGSKVEALRECLNRLQQDSREQKLIHLRYHEGLTSKQIAPLVSQSPVWVRVTLHRIINQLRACVAGRKAVVRC